MLKPDGVESIFEVRMLLAKNNNKDQQEQEHEQEQELPVGIKLEPHVVPFFRYKMTIPRLQKSVLSIEWWVTTPQKQDLVYIMVMHYSLK